VTKTLIDVDEELLVQARALLGDRTTKKEAVNRSLAALVRLGAIREWLRSAEDDGLEQLDERLVLADASVLVRCGEPDVVARLLPLLILDRVATCAAVEHELATLLGGTTDGPVVLLRRISRRWLVTEDADLKRAAEIQAELSQRGEGQISWHRLVIAAVAERHGVPLLHACADIELVSKATALDSSLTACSARTARSFSRTPSPPRPAPIRNSKPDVVPSKQRSPT
jgi:predicted nucleic acid-binding protein